MTAREKTRGRGQGGRPAGPAPRQSRRKHKRRKGELTGREFLRIFLIAALIAFLISTFVISTAVVDGQSMADTLQDGDRVLVLKFHQSVDTLKRGDIIVFRAPDDDKDYIKRVVGLPNEYIEIENGLVYINGDRLNEDYINTAYTGTSGDLSWFVPEGSVFVLGDNRKREASRDSRVFGSVASEALIGRAVLRYYPLSRYGRINP